MQDEPEKLLLEDNNPAVEAARSLRDVPSDIWNFVISEYLSPEDMQKAESQLQHRFKKGAYYFFKSSLDEIKLPKALKAVVTGNPESLIKILRSSPKVLFLKSDVTDPAGQKFQSVSPYQMMIFLCDDDMLAQVLRKIPLAELYQVMKDQSSELRQGGADLVKLDRDPLATGFNFNDILYFKIRTDTTSKVTYPLLQNPDGVLYYKNQDNQVHWYLANQSTKTIEPIELSELTTIQYETYTFLLEKMDTMESMSATRSSDDEYQLFTNVMYTKNPTGTYTRIQLTRNGIHYRRNDISYCDTHYDFNRYYNSTL